MFQMVFPSIIRSSKLHVQRQVFVRPLLLPAASLARLAAGSNIGLYVQFWAPDDGRKNRLKHVKRITEINKLWNVESCWLYSTNILAMHGNMNVKKPTMHMFLIIFARYSSYLMSELSFYTAWDETVHMAASHGVSVVRLPPTKLRASAPQSSLVQLVFETASAEGRSFLFQHSSTPFTSQNSVFDFVTASRRKSSWVIPSSRNTKVVLALGASVNGAGRRYLLANYQTVSGYTSESVFLTF